MKYLFVSSFCHRLTLNKSINANITEPFFSLRGQNTLASSAGEALETRFTSPAPLFGVYQVNVILF